MATLADIENFLNIETADKRLRAGKKKENKNRYYYYNELYYIIELTQGKWMICSDNNETRQLLRDNCWYFNTDGYARTNVQGTNKYYHQLYLNYEEGLVADHVATIDGFADRGLDDFEVGAGGGGRLGAQLQQQLQRRLGLAARARHQQR